MDRRRSPFELNVAVWVGNELTEQVQER
jgi:hypothetical protein